MGDHYTLRRNFSRSAATYDRFNTMQCRAGQLLLDRMQGQPVRILEVGCGTGVFTAALCERFPEATITAVDFSEQMIAVASAKPFPARVQFVTDTIETLRPIQTYDLVTANACLHWLTDIPQCFANFSTLLKNDGGGSFAVFGPRTYGELGNVLAEGGFTDSLPASQSFPSQQQWETWLRSVWQDVEVVTFLETQTYDSLWDLLRKIKYSGTQGAAADRHYFSRRELNGLDVAYRRKYGAIVATYEIYVLHARHKRRTV